MTTKYEYYASSANSVTVGSGTWEQAPYTGEMVDLWAPSFELSRPYWGDPTIIRKPKKDNWDEYVENIEKIKKIKKISEVAKYIEIRPVIICGWCGAKIPRGQEAEECEYCGS